MNMISETRILRGYEKKGDNLKIEIALKGIDLERLQNIFKCSQDDNMYDCYPVGLREKKMLEPYLAEPIELEKFDFFLECDAK